ncbi:hypothetical protein Peur_005670 [Populus x canadensis]
MKNDENGFCGMSGLVEVEQKCMIASWIDTELSTMLFMPVVMVFWRELVSGLRLALDMQWHCQILSLLRSGDRFVVKIGISGSSSACLYFEILRRQTAKGRGNLLSHLGYIFSGFVLFILRISEALIAPSAAYPGSKSNGCLA